MDLEVHVPELSWSEFDLVLQYALEAFRFGSEFGTRQVTGIWILH